MYYIIRLLKRIKPASIKNSEIDHRSKIRGGSQVISTSMGKYSYCGYSCTINNSNIGSFCSIAGNVKIGLSKHPIERASTSTAFYYGRDSLRKNLASNKYEGNINRTIIGNDVRIGSNVLIKSGVRIGNGAVIGMGSVVTKDVGDYEVWAGNPARFIKSRFNEEIINLLLESKWRTLSDENLKKISPYINDPKTFATEALNLLNIRRLSV